VVSFTSSGSYLYAATQIQLGMDSGAVFRSSDQGAHWITLSTGLRTMISDR